MHIPILLGTARNGRNSEKVANYMHQVTTEYGKTAGFTTELLDVRHFDLLGTDNTERTERAKRWSEKMKSSDGLIIVSPEYNHGYPGELKTMLDEIFPEYARKPLGICGVSKGGLGGVRMVEQLRLVAIELHMVPIHSAVYFSNVLSLFDEKGAIKDPSYQEKVTKFLGELAWYANALKVARE